MCVILVDMDACLLVGVDVMVMSSAYEVSYSSTDCCGMSDVYMLKNMGERMPP